MAYEDEELRSYDPSWRDRLRAFVEEHGPPNPEIPLVGSGLPMEGVGEYGLLEMLPTDLIPGRGSVWDRIKSERQLGHSGYAALEGLNALLSAAPAAKPAIRGARSLSKSGLDSLSEAKKALRRSEVPFMKTPPRPKGNIWVQKDKKGFVVRDANQDDKIVARITTHHPSEAQGVDWPMYVSVSTPSESQDILKALVARGHLTAKQAEDFQHMKLGAAGSKEYGSALAANIGYGDQAVTRNVAEQISMDPLYRETPSMIGGRITGARGKVKGTDNQANVPLDRIRARAERKNVPPPGRAINLSLPDRPPSLDHLLWQLKQKGQDLGYTTKQTVLDSNRAIRDKALDKELQRMRTARDKDRANFARDRLDPLYTSKIMEGRKRHIGPDPWEHVQDHGNVSRKKTGGMIRNPYPYEPKSI